MSDIVVYLSCDTVALAERCDAYLIVLCIGELPVAVIELEVLLGDFIPHGAQKADLLFKAEHPQIEYCCNEESCEQYRELDMPEVFEL